MKAPSPANDNPRPTDSVPAWALISVLFGVAFAGLCVCTAIIALFVRNL